MKNVVFIAILLLFSGVLPIVAQARNHGSVLVPDTSMERAQDRGLRAHTNHLIFVRPNFTGTSPSGETPQSLRSVYKLPSTGGGGIIAIVDAFHYPTAASDLNVFSKQFGLPSCTTSNGCFRVVFASGSQPRTNCGWAQEAALDIELAHAMAPSGHIVLVEAASNSFSDLFRAIDVATSASRFCPVELFFEHAIVPPRDASNKSHVRWDLFCRTKRLRFNEICKLDGSWLPRGGDYSAFQAHMPDSGGVGSALL